MIIPEFNSQTERSKAPFGVSNFPRTSFVVLHGSSSFSKTDRSTFRDDADSLDVSCRQRSQNAELPSPRPEEPTLSVLTAERISLLALIADRYPSSAQMAVILVKIVVGDLTNVFQFISRQSLKVILADSFLVKQSPKY